MAKYLSHLLNFEKWHFFTLIEMIISTLNDINIVFRFLEDVKLFNFRFQFLPILKIFMQRFQIIP